MVLITDNNNNNNNNNNNDNLYLKQSVNESYQTERNYPPP